MYLQTREMMKYQVQDNCRLVFSMRKISSCVLHNLVSAQETHERNNTGNHETKTTKVV
jgi:hypothetical protein